MVHLRTLRLSLLLALALVVSAAAGGSRVGTSAFSFLKIGVGARPVAMGGAFTGLADDIHALYYNPAGLALLEQDQYMAGYHSYFDDMQSGVVGYVKKHGFTRSLVVYASYLSLGTFIQTDRNGTVTGEFGGSDLVLAVGYSLSRRETYSFGATVKFIYESVQEFSATGLALDLGAHYTTYRDRLRLGLAVLNLGAQLSTLGPNSPRDPLPTMLRAGVAGRPRGLPLTLAGDLLVPFDNDIEVALGAEYVDLKPVFLRVGWNSFGSNFKGSGGDGAAGLAVGIGIDFKHGWQFSYAFAPGADLGESHRITLTGGLY